jgi:hypothetical protein
MMKGRGGLMRLHNSNAAAFTTLCALLASVLMLAACPRQADENDSQPISGKHLKGAPALQLAPLIYVSGGKLMLMGQDGASKALSNAGRPEIPVSSFDLNLATGEVALACGGQVGVVPLTPKAKAKPEEEEWHDLRISAGKDCYVQLVRLSQDASTLYAEVFQAGNADEGFRMLIVSRQTQKMSEIKLPEEARKMELRDLKVDSTGTPYFFIYDETTPESIIYRVTNGKAEKVFSSEDVLGNGDGDDYGAPLAEAEGVYALEVDDFYPMEGGLLLPVSMLGEGKQKAADGSSELIERTEVWQLDLTGKRVSRRYTLSSEAGGAQSGYSFALGVSGLYFARLAVPEPAKTPAEPAAIPKNSQPATPPGDALGGADGGDEQPPTGYDLMRLVLDSGEVSKVFSSPLGNDFFSLEIFPDAGAVAVINGTDEAFRLDGFDFKGGKLQVGLSVDTPDAYYLPQSQASTS